MNACVQVCRSPLGLHGSPPDNGAGDPGPGNRPAGTRTSAHCGFAAFDNGAHPAPTVPPAVRARTRAAPGRRGKREPREPREPREAREAREKYGPGREPVLSNQHPTQVVTGEGHRMEDEQPAAVTRKGCAEE
ncbi:hypothetical protein FM076_17645 [Streptomyces albus subsp. chlorinus]|nr:hypothetical protein [Streptomyces albus subsp. chlorinus]